MQTLQERRRPTRLSLLLACVCVVVLVAGLIVVLERGRGTSVAGGPQGCFPQNGPVPGPVVFHHTSGQGGLYAIGKEGLYRFSTAGGQLTPVWLYRMHECIVVTPTQVPHLAGPMYPLPYLQDGVTVAENLVFFGVDEHSGSWVDLYALHADTGALAWKTRVTDASGISGMVVSHGLIYVEYATSTDGSGNYTISALDLRDGSVRWSYRYHPTFMNEAEGISDVGSDKLYIASAHTMSALDTATGKQMWSRSVPDSQQVSGAKLFDGVLYITASSGCFNCVVQPSSSAVYAFDPASGVQLWQSQPLDGYLTQPMEARGIVYVGSQDGHLHALRVADGTPLWQSDLGGELHVQPQVIDGLVCVGTALFLGKDDPNMTPTHLFGLDATTGQKRWIYTFPQNEYDGYQPLLAGANMLYTTPNTNLIESVQASTGKLVLEYSVNISGNFLSLVLVP